MRTGVDLIRRILCSSKCSRVSFFEKVEERTPKSEKNILFVLWYSDLGTIFNYNDFVYGIRVIHKYTFSTHPKTL